MKRADEHSEALAPVPPDAVAIIGMSARVPGASSVKRFWQNQLAGIESISHFSMEELEIRHPEQTASQPNYVRAHAILQGVDLFDAEFFGMLPKEAALMDPQHRLFLECCSEALEDAGYDALTYPGAIGVVAGSSYSSYFLSQVAARPGFTEEFIEDYQIGNYAAMMGNYPDYLATRASYKFNLRGPSYTVQSACSTSLVAVCQACQSLLTYQSDMMLAGGVSITFPQKRGYLYQDGGMGSPDGHCRPFDADAQGTVFGSGVGVVLLKRLEDAIADGDQIYSVVRGFATNNDGASRIGYTAPGVDGQASVIAMAQEAAGVDPATIGYVEAHGTATPVGDPIELSALERAFRARTGEKGFCVLGTAKANVGHLDVAAGVTGLIHAAHIVRYGKFPPTLHFKGPTRDFDFAASPFRVNTELMEWPAQAYPRRAGVSAFGVGGTNAHVILEEPPQVVQQRPLRGDQLLVLSARSPAALEQATHNLVEHLEQNPSAMLADVAFTLQVGRRAFEYRRAVAASTIEGAIAGLKDSVALHLIGKKRSDPGICFMFPGQGAQRADMGRGIYETERVFREEVDNCASLLRAQSGVELMAALHPAPGGRLASRIDETWLAQPAIFSVEYALAKLWMSWGIAPRCMIGHSIGEYVAACLAGVLSLPDALRLVAVRGRLMQQMPVGAMLSVRMSAADLAPLLASGLSIAASNAPRLSVASGPLDAIAALEHDLTRLGVAHKRLRTSHAFHSSMMQPMQEVFGGELAKVSLSNPTVPYVSNLSGSWIAPEEATSPSYWTRHLRGTVDFSGGMSLLEQQDDLIFLEVGPGSALRTLARQHSPRSRDRVIVSSLVHSRGVENSEDCEGAAMQAAIGELWSAGAKPDWQKLHAESRRQRVSLPTYPFERKSFWSGALPHGLVESPLAVGPAANQPEARPPVLLPGAIEETLPMSSAPVSVVPPRQERLREMLLGIFEELSGLNIAHEEKSATFLEIGFDSLFLTQVTQALQSKFALKVTFRQLLNDLSTLDALSAYLDLNLGPERFNDGPPAPGSPVRPTGDAIGQSDHVPPAANITDSSSYIPVVSSGPVGQLMQAQLQAMHQLFAQQLAVCGGPPFDEKSGPRLSAPGAAPTEPREASPVESTVAVALKGFTAFKPPQRRLPGDLTPRQRKHISDLVQFYTGRTATSKLKTQEYREYLADPRVVAGFRAQWKEMVYPIVTARSEGSKLWDIDGNEYIDLLNGFGPIMLGHRPSFVEEAIDKQLHQGFEIGPQTLLAGEVAKALCEMTGSERATFCNTGSEAVIAAMRVARTVTGKSRVVSFAGDYHGMFDEVLVKGFKRDGHPQTMALAPGIPRESIANMTVLDYGADESLEWIRAHSGELAAVLVEPVQSRHPDLRPIEFLKEIRRITEQADVCLVFDEVVSGFRVHPGGCQALFDIRADLATYGKVLAGGMPIGVLAGKAKYMDALDGGMWQYGDDSTPETGVTFFAGTFVRHPLAMAACAAVLKYLKEEGPGLQERLSAGTRDLVARLNALFLANNVPTKIASFASFFFFSFPGDFRFGSLFYYHLRAKGIHLLEGFPCFLTTAHSDRDLDRVVVAFAETIAEMQADDLLPVPSPAAASQIDATAPIPEVALASTAPITEPQMEMLLSAELSSEANCSYNESFSLHLHGLLDQRSLADSLSDLLVRHDALRATFDLESRTQCFSPPVPVNLAFLDLSQQDPVSRKVRFSAFIAADACQPFDLAHGLLVRMALVRFGPEHHVLLFTSHHAVCDGWSINVLLDELAALYTARVEGKTCELQPVMLFSAYARSQQDYLQGAEGAKMEAFWLNEFKALPPLLDLPIDRPRPAMKSFRGATFRRKIGPDALKQIKRAGAQQKCTLFVTLLGGFIALLGRLTGQDDIVVGVPTAGQSLIEGRALVGHCVNFVPIRGRPTDDVTAALFLERMRKTVFDAYDHQDYTFGRLVRKLSIPRDSSRLPLLEVQFNLEKLGANLAFSGLKVEVDPNPKSFVNFDVFVNAVEAPGGLALYVDYNSDLIDEATIVEWMDCYEVLLKGFIGNGEQPLAQLPILGPDALSYLTLNKTESAYPSDLCVYQLFERQVTAAPNSVALLFEGEQLTYAQLNARVNKLARYLMSSGVQPEDIVAIYMERSVEMVVALLAIWKAGAAYIPLDPTFPAERLRMVFEDLSGPMILTQERLASDLPSTSSRVLRIDALWPLIELEDGVNPDIESDSSRLAYVIYTSGSTGRPKGVEVRQSSVVNLLTSMAKKPGFTEKDVLVAVTTISFDIAALEIYLPLITGARLVLASRAVASDGSLLLKLLSDSGATVMQATPVTFRLLLAAGWSGRPRFNAWCGGEALPRNLANQILDCGVELWNMYGPTETTIWSATARVESREGPVLVGPPIDNTQFYVLDAHEQLVPTGVAGELYIGGDGVARGYFNRPDLTAARFIQNKFCSKSGPRLYRTGDMVRRLRSGEFEFLGRTDGQVKLRGFRVELGEIESALAAHGQLDQAVVALREDTPGDKRLVAYIVAKSSVPANADLRSYLLNKLPDYMVPSAFIALKAVPLTANGKIDRRALPAPDWAPAAGGVSYVPPRSSQEAALAKIWEEVLHLERVGIEDNMYELGADSLHVFQIAARANRAGIDVKPRQILQYRTIAAVMANLATLGARPQSAPLLPVSRAKYRIAQQRLTVEAEDVEAAGALKR